MSLFPHATLRTLNDTFRGYRRHFAALTVLGIFSAALEGIGVNAIIPLFSFLIGSADALPGDFISQALRELFAFFGIPFTLKFLLIFITLLFLSRAVALTVFAYIRARISGSYMSREMSFLFSRLLRARWPFLATQKAGYLQNTLFWDVKQSTNLLDSIVQFAQSSTGFLMYLLIASSISPTITFATIIVGAALLIGLRPLVRKTTVFGEEKSRIEKGYANYLSENIQGLKTVKASGVGGVVYARGYAFLDRLRVVYTKAAVIHSSGMTIIQPFSFVFILVLFAIAYQMPAFNLAAFAAVLYLIQKIFVYLQSTQSALHTIADLVPFAANVSVFKQSLLDNTEVVSHDDVPFHFEGALSFEDVSVSYPTRPAALSSISFNLPKGSLLGMIGPSGGGKTSVADVILRLLTPTEGVVTLDGKPIDRFSIDEWRRAVAYVSQDIFLMDASVSDNIRFYDDSLSDEAVREAAQKAQILDVVEKLPEGFDTVIGERGVTLSVGQRQRIVLARALARKPEIMVLDEATSALDSESEMAIKEVIESMRGKVTLIVIAHRMATVQNADTIIVIKDGKVVEQGTPAEMLTDSNSYLARMKSLQGAL